MQVIDIIFAVFLPWVVLWKRIGEGEEGESVEESVGKWEGEGWREAGTRGGLISEKT